MSKEKKENYIPLSEATKYCDYSQAYLNLRVRQGKLKAVKFGRNWMTKKEWVEDYVARMDSENGNGDYIPLSEATKYCDYSQAYLNLRVRQGKLKAVKFGRNWMTKKEWVEDYVAKVKKYKKKKAAKKKTSLGKIPFGLFDVLSPARTIKLDFQKKRKRIGAAYALAVVSVAFLTFSVMSLGAQGYNNKAMNKISATVEDIGEKGNDFWDYSLGTVQRFSDIPASQKEELFSGYFSWAYNRVSFLVSGIRNIPSRIAGLFSPGQEIAKKPMPGPEEGMVVIPSVEGDEEAKDKIMTSFSDEVKIKPEDKTSGIIIPVFKKGPGEEYMYVMVPTKEEKK